MNLKFNLISFVSGTLVGFLVFTLGEGFLNSRSSVPKAVIEGVNAAKSGDYVVARKLLENNLMELDIVGTSALVDMYALGDGGHIDTYRATSLIRLLDCRYFAVGEKEFYISNLLLKKDANSATAWLLRSAEAGYLQAQSILSNSEKLKGIGFNPVGVDSDYWGERIKKPLPNELVKRLTNCNPHS
jgi:hypothetical protein